MWSICVFITAGPSTKLVTWGVNYTFRLLVVRYVLYMGVRGESGGGNIAGSSVQDYQVHGVDQVY